MKMWTSCNIELDNYAIVENKTKHWVQQTYIHCMGFATYDMYKQNFKFENSQLKSLSVHSIVWHEEYGKNVWLCTIWI
jgi:hypothetical protein